MSNKTIAIVVGVVLVLGGVYFGFGGMSKESGMDSVSNEVEVNNESNTSTESGKKMAFSQFIKQGGAYVCTVKQSMEGMESEGTVYVNDGSVRGEFKSSVAGMNIDTNFLSKDGYSYSWSSTLPGKGFKVALQNESGNTSTKVNGTYSFDDNLIGDYNCDSWRGDSSKFDLPKGVVFTEVKQ